MISAITAIFAKHRKTIDAARLTKVLAGTNCEKLVANARNVRELMKCSTEAAMIAAVLSGYDRGLPQEKRLSGTQQVAA